MNCKNRLKLIHKFSDMFALKGGEILKCKTDNKCYRTHKWFSALYYIWFGELSIYFIILLTFGIYYFDVFKSIFNNGWIIFGLSLSLALLIYVTIEFMLIFVVPLFEIECWKVNMESERLRNKEIMKGNKW